MASWSHDPVYRSPRFHDAQPEYTWDPDWWLPHDIRELTKDHIIRGTSDWVWGRPKIDIRAFNKATRAQGIVHDQAGERTMTVLQRLPDNLTWSEIYDQMVRMGYEMLKLRNPFQFDPLTWESIERPLGHIQTPELLDGASLLFRATEIPLPMRLHIFVTRHGA
jgi:hypothetical protein